MKLHHMLACAAMLAAFAPAIAAQAETLEDGQSKAVLMKAATAPVEVVIDGRIWRCEGSECVANPNDGADQQRIGTECHRAAFQLGKFSAYQTGAKALSDTELAACNARIAK
jgi:hypothetical protein